MHSIKLNHMNFSGVIHIVSLIFRPHPALQRLQYRDKSGRGPGIFSHMSDIRIERMVERVQLSVYSIPRNVRYKPR